MPTIVDTPEGSLLISGEVAETSLRFQEYLAELGYLPPRQRVVAMSMRGVVSSAKDGYWIANMSHPSPFANVELHPDLHFLVRLGNGRGSRIRITTHHVPDPHPEVGDRVVAHVAAILEKTGQDIPNPRILEDGELPFIPETRVLGGIATRWGFVPREA